MNFKAISLAAAFAFSAVGSAALAGALDEPATIGPFYTDSSLKSLRPMPELKAAFKSMPKEKREEVVRLCNDPSTTARLNEFCDVVNTLHKMQ
ncbi:hypothetical protein LHFGNBLO_000106 [Mesorhizobium sp. AR10]|nr:hypothetical protein LHFGNBLO_000106 [Mesorhizobium sp. AR10]